MTKELITKVRDAEKACSLNVEDAKKKAEEIKLNAKSESKTIYDTEVAKAVNDYEEKIKSATLKADKMIADAVKSGEEEKKNLIMKLKDKQSKVVDDLINILVA